MMGIMASDASLCFESGSQFNTVNRDKCKQYLIENVAISLFYRGLTKC